MYFAFKAQNILAITGEFLNSEIVVTGPITFEVKVPSYVNVQQNKSQLWSLVSFVYITSLGLKKFKFENSLKNQNC